MNFLLGSLFVFVLCLCKTKVLLIFFLLVLFFYQLKFKKFTYKDFLLIGVVYLLSFSNFSFRNHCIIETHEKYAIASIQHRKVLVYTDELFFENEGVEVHGELQKINSFSNFNSFDFSAFMNHRNITEFSGNAVFTKQNSLKRRIYEKILRFDRDIAQMLLNLFYQFESSDDLIYSSGMHLSFLNHIFFFFFSMFFSKKTSRICTILMNFLVSCLFPYRFAMLRILLSNGISLFFENKSRYEKTGYWAIACMALSPGCCFSMSFVIPFVLRLSSLFLPKTKQRINRMLLLSFIQFLMTGKCTVLSVLGFSVFQRCNAFSFLLGLAQIQLHSSILHQLMKIVEQLLRWMNAIVIYGHVPLLIGSIFVYFYIVQKKKKDRFICLLCLLFLPFQGYLNPFYRVVFLNVGQGDAVVLLAPFHQASILIDVPLNKEQIVIDYLRSIGIMHLDKVIITHDDADHSGGVEALSEKYPVKEILREPQDLSIGQMKMFSVNEKIYDNENDNSLVYFSTIASLNYCFMGDASVKVEKDIVNKIDFKCDILKVGHHGSKTSSSSYFLQHVSPSIAYISASQKNRYGHPHQEVLDNLERYGICVIESYKMGALEIKSMGRWNFVRTSNKEFGIMIQE